jgi:hypothetical protein
MLKTILFICVLITLTTSIKKFKGKNKYHLTEPAYIKYDGKCLNGQTLVFESCSGDMSNKYFTFSKDSDEDKFYYVSSQFGPLHIAEGQLSVNFFTIEEDTDSQWYIVKSQTDNDTVLFVYVKDNKICIDFATMKPAACKNTKEFKVRLFN